MNRWQIHQQELVEEANRHLKDRGGARKQDSGEPLRASPAFDEFFSKKWGLNHPDKGQLQANWLKFKKSSDYRRMTTYRNKYI